MLHEGVGGLTCASVMVVFEEDWRGGSISFGVGSEAVGDMRLLTGLILCGIESVHNSSYHGEQLLRKPRIAWILATIDRLRSFN